MSIPQMIGVQFGAEAGLQLQEQISGSSKKGGWPRTMWNLFQNAYGLKAIGKAAIQGFEAGGLYGAAADAAWTGGVMYATSYLTKLGAGVSTAYMSRAKYRTEHMAEMRAGTHINRQESFMNWKLARAAYGENEYERRSAGKASGYKYLEKLSTDRVAVYRKGKNLNLAIRGSDFTDMNRVSDDVIADALILLGKQGLSDVFMDAENTVDKITKNWKIAFPKSKINLSGHSLGGSIALHISTHKDINDRIETVHAYEPGRSPFDPDVILPDNAHINVNRFDPVSGFYNANEGGKWHFHDTGDLNVHSPSAWDSYQYWADYDETTIDDLGTTTYEPNEEGGTFEQSTTFQD